MKRLISILCVALLLCSAMTLSVSAAGTGTQDDPIVCSGLNFNMVKVPAGATYYVTFTDTSGAAKRQISINSTTDKEAGYSVVYGNATENSDENGYCNMIVAPDNNGTYFFTITNNSTKQATYFVQKANEFEANIWLESGSRKMNAKSLLGIMSLSIVTGATVTLSAIGSDAEAALNALEVLLQRDVF